MLVSYLNHNPSFGQYFLPNQECEAKGDVVNEQTHYVLFPVDPEATLDDEGPPPPCYITDSAEDARDYFETLGKTVTIPV